MTRAILLTGDNTDGPVLWGVTDNGALIDNGTAEGLADLPDGVRDAASLVAILPGTRAATRSRRLPVTRERALAAAARLGFEDVLADPAEGYHIAAGPADGEGMRPVTAIPRDAFEDWMAAFAAVGIDPETVTLDHLALAGAAPASVLAMGDRWIVVGPEGGFTADPEFARDQVAALGLPEGTEHLATTQASIRPDGAVTLTDDRALLSLLAARAGLHDRLVDLRTGPYRRRTQAAPDWQRWRGAMALAATALVLFLTTAIVDGTRYQRATDRTEAEARAAFAAAFPEVRTRDLGRAARARQADGGTAFLPLMAALTTALEEGESVLLRAVTYGDEQVLIADLEFPDAAAFEALRARIEAGGVSAREGRNLRRTDDGGYAGQLQLRGGA